MQPGTMNSKEAVRRETSRWHASKSRPNAGPIFHKQGFSFLLVRKPVCGEEQREAGRSITIAQGRPCTPLNTI